MVNAVSCLLLIVITASIPGFAQSTVGSVPNQKLVNGSYVSNPDHILNDSTIQRIDATLKRLEDSSTAQVAVVVLQSIGEEDVFEFAQQLFNSWGIGNSSNDNGLLILMVLDQRTIRFHTGRGLEGPLPDVTCKRIEREHMVPAFKAGNYDAGLLAGIEQVTKILTDPRYAEEIKSGEVESVSDWTAFLIFLGIFVAPFPLIGYIVRARNGRFSDSKSPEHTDYPELRIRRRTWLILFVGVPVLIIALFGFSHVESPVGGTFAAIYFYFMSTLLFRWWREKKVIRRFLASEEYYEIVEFLRKKQWYWFLMAIVFPIPFALYFPYHLYRKRRYRNYPRKCKQCAGAMRKLSEKNEDEYLSAEQQLEEKIKSVDYDVWKCSGCNAVEMWFYLGRQSKYTVCPKCKTIAWHQVSKRVVEAATYSSSGSGEVIYACGYCSHKTRSTYTISRLEESSSSSSSSFSSSSSSDSGSWGGGSSSGGGASSTW